MYSNKKLMSTSHSQLNEEVRNTIRSHVEHPSKTIFTPQSETIEYIFKESEEDHKIEDVNIENVSIPNKDLNKNQIQNEDEEETKTIVAEDKNDTSSKVLKKGRNSQIFATETTIKAKSDQYAQGLIGTSFDIKNLHFLEPIKGEQNKINYGIKPTRNMQNDFNFDKNHRLAITNQKISTKSTSNNVQKNVFRKYDSNSNQCKSQEIKYNFNSKFQTTSQQASALKPRKRNVEKTDRKIKEDSEKNDKLDEIIEADDNNELNNNAFSSNFHSSKNNLDTIVQISDLPYRKVN